MYTSYTAYNTHHTKVQIAEYYLLNLVSVVDLPFFEVRSKTVGLGVLLLYVITYIRIPNLYQLFISHTAAVSSTTKVHAAGRAVLKRY